MVRMIALILIFASQFMILIGTFLFINIVLYKLSNTWSMLALICFLSSPFLLIIGAIIPEKEERLTQQKTTEEQL